MFNFIDIHCHSLSRIDDGAANSSMMKKMLDIAYADNIKTVCFTPHFKIYEFENENDIVLHNSLIKQMYDIATDYVKDVHPDMTLHLGNEIMYHNDFFDSLSSGSCLTINNSVYVLVEFSPNVTEFDIRTGISRILRKGYIPLIAHIERYGVLVKDIELLLELKSMGALFQINAKSVTKIKLGKAASFIKTVLKRRLVDVVATDAHDDEDFTPVLSKAYSSISKRYGEVYAKKLFCDNPNAILNNEKFI